MAAGETPVFANVVNGFDVSESESEDADMEADDDGEDGKNAKRAKKAKPIKRKEPRRKPLSPAKKAAVTKTIKPKKARAAAAAAKNTPKTKKPPAAASKGPKPPNWRLKVNTKVDVRHEDPFFEAKRAAAGPLPFPFVSSVTHSKLLFNAVHNGDAAFLKRVCEDVKHVHTLKVSSAARIALV